MAQAPARFDKDIPVRSTIQAVSSPDLRLHALPSGKQVVSPPLRVPDNAAASVFAAVRMRGPIARDVIARVTSLSIATVNRQVGALLDAGLLRERADLSPPGAIGRPRVPVQVHHEPFLTLGIHIGARMTSIVATDLLGRTLDAVEAPTPRGGPDTALPSLAQTAQRYLARWRRRRALWAGVAIGGVVESHAGTVDHARLGWTAAPVGAMFAKVLGMRVSVASHVDAMAASELLLGLRRFVATPTTSLYVYARETVGYAQVIDGRVHTPASGPGSIAALPVHSELLGASGRLETTVSDEAVLTAAHTLQILPAAGPGSSMPALLRAARSGDPRARELLDERARVLGEAIALLRDMLNPDELVVGGQAFTGYPEAMTTVETACAQRSVLPRRDVRMTAFGNHVQEAAAGIVSLSVLYADPIGAMRRAIASHPGAALDITQSTG